MLAIVKSHYDLEEGTSVSLDFNKISTIGADQHEVLPVVVQDVDSGDVLIVAYANEEAYLATLERGEAVFYSTSRHQLWHKGETSGDTLEIIDVRVNCEQNSLLYRVRLNGTGSCHTKDKEGTARRSCYYRTVISPGKLTFS